MTDTSASNIPNDQEIERAAGYLEAANNLLAQRFNYALVAHAMALTAYATCVGVHTFVAFVVGVGGLLYSYVQFLVTHPLSKKIDALRKGYLNFDPVYKVYKEAHGGKRKRGLQSKWVPAGLSIIWLSLLIYALMPTVRSMIGCT